MCRIVHERVFFQLSQNTSVDSRVENAVGGIEGFQVNSGFRPQVSYILKRVFYYLNH